MELYGLKIRSGAAVPFFSLFYGITYLMDSESRSGFAIPRTPLHGIWDCLCRVERAVLGTGFAVPQNSPWNDSPLAGFIENSCRSFRINYLSALINGRKLEVSNVAVGNSFQSFRLLLF